MRNSMKKTLSLLLALGMTLSLAACATGGDKESEPVLMVPATQPDYSDETLAPIYTRPAEDSENPEENVENPEGGDSITGDVEDPEFDPEEDPNGESGGGSSGGASADTDTGDTFADGSVSSNMQGSAKNLNWTNINSFKIKSSSMSVAEMRKLCVDFFRFSKTALWTPDESIQFIRNAAGAKDSMQGGSLYGGLPYVGVASGNIYRLMDYLDTNNGKVDMADALNLTGGTMDKEALKYFGNQCANGAFTGWGRVINSVEAHYTAGMTKANGYLPLGDYKYDTANIKNWSNKDGRRTTDIVKANGEQVMFESYAKLQMGDGLVYYTTAGHVIMAATNAVVVRNADGTINGNDSYITIIDQAQSWETVTSGGKTFQHKSSVDAKVSFQKLFGSNYLPFTFAEFLGTDKVESTSVSISHSGDTATLDQLYKATVTGNYAVSDAYIIVKDASGKEVFKHAVRNSSNWSKKLKMAATGANVDFWGTAPTSGSYTVEVVAQLSTGERPTVYTGTLAF